MLEEEENGIDPRLQAISAAIRVVPHFPKPGIMFNDITPLLLHPKAFKDAVEIFVDRYRDMRISAVAGVEARGFIFGPSIALAIGAKFVPLCKPGKLLGEVISETYVLEYGTDCLEMDLGAVQPGERVIVVDDLVATGGTLCAAMRLLEVVALTAVAFQVYCYGALPHCAGVLGLPHMMALAKHAIEYADNACFCGHGNSLNMLAPKWSSVLVSLGYLSLRVDLDSMENQYIFLWNVVSKIIRQEPSNPRIVLSNMQANVARNAISEANSRSIAKVVA